MYDGEVRWGGVEREWGGGRVREGPVYFIVFHLIR